MGFARAQCPTGGQERLSEAHVAEGYRWVVDLDLEKFFDRVNHDILMARVARESKTSRYSAHSEIHEAGFLAFEGRIVSPRQERNPLLVAGSHRELNKLKAERNDFIVVSETTELQEKILSSKAPIVLAILLGMMALMTLGWVANVTAVILAALAVVVAGALKMEDVYKSINWESVILIAAILPMATALEKTGALALIVKGLLDSAGDSSNYVMLLLLFLLTSLLSQVISNTATSVLIAPIAFQLAMGMGLSPYPFLMIVAVAASTSFATPVASQVNALVINPGNYRFKDFFKVGVLLQIIILLTSLLIIPLIFPF